MRNIKRANIVGSGNGSECRWRRPGSLIDCVDSGRLARSDCTGIKLRLFPSNSFMERLGSLFVDSPKCSWVDMNLGPLSPMVFYS